jgi:fructose-1,6-bisphosphatase/inositol monophosphatase family enzyme
MSEQIPLNGHAVGIVLKELVRRAIKTIRAEREVFEVKQKAGYGGDMTDVFTTADSKAQRIYVRSLEECFPGFGIIAEEGSLSEAQFDERSYFTVDPLDGTKAFIRRQSHGVGTMVAMVEDGQVVAAYVGDVNTQEIYGYRPGSSNVHRITEFETAERLTHTKKPLSDQNILLRDPPSVYAETSRNLLPHFESYEIEGGSIGISLARLWKREVAAVLLYPGGETPWDSTPIRGISEQLGYLFLRPSNTSFGWEVWAPPLPKKVTSREHDVLVIHRDDLGALQSAASGSVFDL